MFSYHTLNYFWISRPALVPSVDFSCFEELWKSKRWTTVASGLSREAFGFARGLSELHDRFSWAISFRVLPSLGIRIFVVNMLARRYRDDINRLSYSGAAGHRAESVPFASGPRSRRRPVSRAIRSPSSVRSRFGIREVRSAIVFLLGEFQVK